MISKLWLAVVYAAALFNMLVVNSIRYPQNIQNILGSDPAVWLYPEVQRALDLITGSEVPYQEERDLLESRED